MHIEKFKKKQLGILGHSSRKTKNHSNENISSELSKLNYNLLSTPRENEYKYVLERCKELNCLQRADVNMCCGICLSLPKNKEFTEEEARMFFSESYKFFVEKFGGEDNVVSAYVHLDEVYSSNSENDKKTHKHLHFYFIPVHTYETCEFSEETGEISTVKHSKVSAKEVLNRSLFKTIHKDLQNYLDKHLTFQADVITGSTLGTKSMEEYKKIKELENEKSILDREINDLRANTSALIGYNSTLKKQQKEMVEVIGNAIQSYDTVRSDETSHWIKQRFDSLKNELYGSKEVIKEVEKQEKKFQEKSKERGIDFEL